MKKQEFEEEKRRLSPGTMVAFVSTAASFLLAFLYLMGSITGRTIDYIGQGAAYNAGIVFFVIGLFGTFLLLRKK